MSHNNIYALPLILKSGNRKIACDYSNKRLKNDLSVCPKCLRKFKDGIDDHHIRDCHPQFSHPVHRNLTKLIVRITPGSPDSEKLVCERFSKCSAIDQQYPHPVLRKNKWIRNGWHLRCFLLTDRDEIASYIVMGRVNSLEHDEFGLFHQDIICDMFTAQTHRRHTNMRKLLPIALKATGHTFESVWFQEPISDQGEKFLEYMSKKTGLPYRTC
jgi:hypothetical protein